MLSLKQTVILLSSQRPISQIMASDFPTSLRKNNRCLSLDPQEAHKIPGVPKHSFSDTAQEVALRFNKPPK